MLNLETSSQNLKKFEIHQKDFYSLDKAVFYKIESAELWDFSSSKEVRFEFIPFFIMRAILHKKLTQEPIELLNFPTHFKTILSKFGSSIPLNDFFTGTFFLSLATKVVTSNLSFYEKFIPEYQFYKEMKNKNFIICGGGILEKSNILLKPFIQELFSIFDLENQKGKFYFRTQKHSYFYPLDKKQEPQIFFVQERENFPIPFHFFYIEIEKE